MPAVLTTKSTVAQNFVAVSSQMLVMTIISTQSTYTCQSVGFNVPLNTYSPTHGQAELAWVAG